MLLSVCVVHDSKATSDTNLEPGQMSISKRRQDAKDEIETILHIRNYVREVLLWLFADLMVPTRGEAPGEKPQLKVLPIATRWGIDELFDTLRVHGEYAGVIDSELAGCLTRYLEAYEETFWEYPSQDNKQWILELARGQQSSWQDGGETQAAGVKVWVIKFFT